MVVVFSPPKSRMMHHPTTRPAEAVIIVVVATAVTFEGDKGMREGRWEARNNSRWMTDALGLSSLLFGSTLSYAWMPSFQKSGALPVSVFRLKGSKGSASNYYGNISTPQLEPWFKTLCALLTVFNKCRGPTAQDFSILLAYSHTSQISLL